MVSLPRGTLKLHTLFCEEGEILMASDEAQLNHRWMADSLLTFFLFFFFLKSKPQIGLRAAIYNLSGEAGI